MAKFSRAAFIAIAQAINLVYKQHEGCKAPDPGAIDEGELVMDVAESIADVFNRDNALFDRKRFLAAVRGDK